MQDAIPYIEHYFHLPEVVYFLFLALGALFAVLLLLAAFSKITAKKATADPAALSEDNPACRRFICLSQKYYELVYSGTSILFFITVYYLIDRFYDYYPVKSVLVKYESFLLLLLIVLSCLLNSFLDKVFTKLIYLRSDDRTSIRIIGMLYMLLIFGYVKFIYENNNYDYFITYFLSLMIGRFVYFDASFKDFWSALVKALKNFPLMLLGLGVTGFLSWVGFVKTDYLIKHIGVITNVFILHLFMCIAIFILFHIHPENFLFRKKSRKTTETVEAVEAAETVKAVKTVEAAGIMKKAEEKSGD